MAITLTHAASSTTLTLPPHLNWVNEYGWSPVQQSTDYTTTGALLIEEATKQSGRPITLEGITDHTWCTRANVEQLHAWAQIPGIQLTLTIRGVVRNVTFDHERGAFQGLPLWFCNDDSIASDDWYVPTLRFLEL